MNKKVKKGLETVSQKKNTKMRNIQIKNDKKLINLKFCF